MRNFEIETFEEADAYDKHSDQQYNCGLLLIKELGIKQGSIVLDIGAGTGRLGLYVGGLIGREGSYFGIDLSPERINITKKKAEVLNASNLFFEVGNGTDLSHFADGFFDVVYMNSVFHWIKDKRKTCRECYRVLKPGGRFGFAMQIKNLPRNNVIEIADTVLKKRGYNISFSNPDNYPITVDEARGILKETGFLLKNIGIRKIKDNFGSLEEEVDSIISGTTHRNFLKNVPLNEHPEIRNEIVAELKKIETEEGFNLIRNKLYVLAEKGSN
ncbi:MAG TPA: methyltransferase domain-containing protein [Candidatus Methanoperedens sp.]